MVADGGNGLSSNLERVILWIQNAVKDSIYPYHDVAPGMAFSSLNS